jgi:mannose-1-phosphate guanylyltransferase
MYAVILAGGGGTRLWPLSLPERPKPFLPLLGDHSLLQRTAARLLDGPELGLAAADLTVVTERRYAAIVGAQLPAVNVLGEPRGRNTAAAIALATLAIERDDDEIMLVLPADQTVANEAAFRATLRAAHDELAHGALDVETPLVTLGVAPREPATDYGYLIPDPARARRDGLHAYVLKAFEEKPTQGRARELVGQPGVAWNAGIFMWTRAAIRAALERYTGLIALLDGSIAPPSRLDAAYDHITPVSIDYALMEGAARDGSVLMAAMDVGWSDLGTWTSLLAALGGSYKGLARVVPAGEPVAPAAGDLLIRRERGRLVLDTEVAGTISSDGPMALLPGAREHAAVIGDLIARVARQEEAE